MIMMPDTIGPVTWAMLALFCLLTISCHLGVTSPLQYYFSVPLILRGQLWRLICNVFYLGGTLSLDLAIYLLYFMSYTSSLESVQFRNKKIDFIYMVCLIVFLLNICAPYTGALCMSHSFVFTMIYLWTRHNPNTMFSFIFVQFRAVYLPFAMLLFSYFGGREGVTNDLCGMIVGHIYFFFKRVVPDVTAQRWQPLETPKWFSRTLLSIYYCFVRFSITRWIFHLQSEYQAYLREQQALQQQQQQQQQQQRVEQQDDASTIHPPHESDPTDRPADLTQNPTLDNVSAATQPAVVVSPQFLETTVSLSETPQNTIQLDTQQPEHLYYEPKQHKITNLSQFKQHMHFLGFGALPETDLYT